MSLAAYIALNLDDVFITPDLGDEKEDQERIEDADS
jgi:hypothetical protein